MNSMMNLWYGSLSNEHQFTIHNSHSHLILSFWLCGWKLNKINDANTKHWVFFFSTFRISNTHKKTKCNSTIRVDWLHQRLIADPIQIRTMRSKWTTKNYKYLPFFQEKKTENIFSKCIQLNVMQQSFKLMSFKSFDCTNSNWLGLFSLFIDCVQLIFSHSLHIASIKSQFFFSFLYLCDWPLIPNVNSPILLFYAFSIKNACQIFKLK